MPNENSKSYQYLITSGKTGKQKWIDKADFDANYQQYIDNSGDGYTIRMKWDDGDVRDVPLKDWTRGLNSGGRGYTMERTTVTKKPVTADKTTAERAQDAVKGRFGTAKAEETEPVATQPVGMGIKGAEAFRTGKNPLSLQTPSGSPLMKQVGNIDAVKVATGQETAIEQSRRRQIQKQNQKQGADIMRTQGADIASEVSKALGKGNAKNVEELKTSDDWWRSLASSQNGGQEFARIKRAAELGEAETQKAIDSTDWSETIRKATMNADGTDYNNTIKSGAMQEGISEEDYVDKYVLPELSNVIAMQLHDQQADAKKVKGDADYLMRSLRQSWTGQLFSMATQTRNQRQLESEAMQNYGQNVGWGMKAASIGMSTLGDMPLFFIGGGAGNLALRGAAGATGVVGKGLAKVGATKAGQIVANFAPKASNFLLPNTAKVGGHLAARYENFLLANMAKPAWYGRALLQGGISGTANMSTFMGTKALTDQLSIGDDTSGSALLGAYLEGAKEGAKMGGALAITSPFSRLLGSYASRGFTRMGAGLLGKGVEVGTFVGMDAIGNDDFDFTDSVAENTAMIVGMHFGAHPAQAFKGLASGLYKGFRGAMYYDTGRTEVKTVGGKQERVPVYKFNPLKATRDFFVNNSVKGHSVQESFRMTDADLEAIKREYPNSTLAQIADMRSMDDAKRQQFAKLMDFDGKYGSNFSGQLGTEYSDVLQNKRIPWVTRNKLSTVLFGVSDASKPLYSTHAIIGGGDNKRVRLISADGEVIEEKPFKNMDDLNNIITTERLNAEHERTINKLAQFTIKEGIDDATKQEAEEALSAVAVEYGMSEEDVFALMFKNPLKMTEEERAAFKQLGRNLTTTIERANEGREAVQTSAEIGREEAEDANIVDEAHPETVKALEDNVTATLNAATNMLAGKDIEGDVTIENLQKWFAGGEITEDDAKVICNYLNAKAKYDGFVARTAEKIDERVQMEWLMQNHNGTDTRVTAVDKDGKMVFLKDGEIGADGSISSMSGMVTVVDAETGEIDFRSAEGMKATEQIGKDDFVNARTQELQIAVTQANFGSGEANGGNNATEGNGSEATADGVGTPAEATAEAQVEAPAVATTEAPTAAPTSEIPTDGEGNKIYDGVEPKRAYEDILNDLGGDKAMADEAIDGEIRTAEKALKKAKEKNVNGVAQMRAKKEAIDNAQKTLDMWKAIKEAGKADAEPNMAPETGTEGKASGTVATEQPAVDASGAVPDMSVDKASDARARGFRMVNGMRVDRQVETEGTYGNETSIDFSNDETINAKWKIISADQLQPSHIGAERNPLHFIPEGQPKERDDAASNVASDEIGRNIDPTKVADATNAYFGAPVVNKHGEVIQGNNRSMGLKKMTPESKVLYKEWLKKNADKFGLKAEDIDKMENPVLVREADVTDEEAIRLGNMTVNDLETGGIERIDAKKTLAKMTPEQIGDVMRRMFDTGDAEDMTVGQLIDENGLDVLKAMNRMGVISDTQYQSAFRNGKLSDEAKNDLRKLMLQSLFEGGNDNLEKMYDSLPSAAQKALLPIIAGDMRLKEEDRLKGEIQKAIEIVSILTNTLSPEELAEAKKDQKTALEKIDEASKSVDMFTGATLDGYSEEAKIIASHLLTGTQKKIKAIFDEYQRLVNGNEANLFEAAQKLERGEAFDKAFGVELKKEKDNEKEVSGPDAGKREGEPDGEGESRDVPGRGGEGRGAVEVPFAEDTEDPVEKAVNEYISQNPLTEKEIDDADVSATRKAMAKDFLKGRNTSELAKSHYRSVYNKVHPKTEEGNTEVKTSGTVAERPKADKGVGTPSAEKPKSATGESSADTEGTTAKPQVSTAEAEAARKKALEIIERMKSHKNKPSTKGDTDAYNIDKLNDEQNDDMLDLLDVGAELGYEYLKSGALKSKEEWKQAMRDAIAEPLKDATGFDDKDVDDLFEDMWNSHYADGEKMQSLADWAKEFGINEKIEDNEEDINPGVQGEERPSDVAGDTGAEVREGETDVPVSDGGDTRPDTPTGGRTNVREGAETKPREQGGGKKPRVSNGNDTGNVRGSKSGDRPVRGANDGGGTGGGRERGSESTGASDVGRNPVEEAKEKAYNESKEAIAKEENIDTLKGLRTQYEKELAELGEDADEVKKAELEGKRQAVIDKLRELIAKQPKQTVNLNQEKVPYVSAADPEGKHAIGSVMPSVVADAMNTALKNLVEREGKSVAEFVRDELGYSSDDEMFSDYANGKTNGLASEQVDSVALAISKMKQGKAFIVGDMTGVGKGRQAAALIRWGKLQGKKVLFITENSGLFSDMYRDLTDIDTDLLPFVVNSDSQANITDSEGVKIIPKPSPNEQKALWQSEGDALPTIKKGKNKGRQYDFLMMTYSQASNVKGASAEQKIEWIKRYAKDAIVIMDESHNASGSSNRGDYFRDIVKEANGVTFLSATYAKRPDNLMLYALKSSISDTNMSEQAMIEAIQKYGVPMQEILANALFANEEMVRRERDFSDVKTTWVEPKDVYNEEEISQYRKTSDKTMELMNEIIDFQRDYINPIVREHDKEYAESNALAALMGAPQTHARNTAYAGQASNILGLMVYGMKARKSAEMAIEQIKAGKKPVIAVENTLGSYIDNIEGNIDNADFSAVFDKGIAFALRYKIATGSKTDENGKPNPDYREDIFDAENELDGDGMRALERIRRLVKEYQEDNDKIDLTLSPIDLIKNMLAEAGYKCGEITGRGNRLVQNADGTYTKESFSTDKKKAALRFNGGSKINPLSKEDTYDALILNVAGATGISLHASSKFGDQRPRTMIILQPARNVNTEVQMRGRIDRTGQVSRGEYFYLTSPIPAEQKITMMLKQKLASLDANSVGTKDVSSNKVEGQDMDNKYGDEVCKNFLLEHLNDINSQLEKGLQFNNKTREWEGREGLLYDVLKNIQRLDCDTQEYILDELTTRYADQIDYLNQNGINDLTTSVMELDATTIDKAIFIKGKDNESDNYFAHDTTIERVEANVLKKPLRSADMQREMKKLGVINDEGKIKDNYSDEITSKVDEARNQILADRKAKHEAAEAKLEARIRENHPKRDDVSEEDYENMIKNWPTLLELKMKNSAEYKQLESDLESQYNNVVKAGMYLKPGRPCLVPMTDDVSDGSPSSYGRFIGFQIKGSGPRGVQAVFAVKDSRAKINIPIVNQMKSIDKIINDSRHDIELSQIGGDPYDWKITEEMRQTARDEWWDKMIPKNTNRTTRYMITGNVLQACGSLGKYKGQIVTFTRKDKETGEITNEKGMLLAENFDPENFKSRRAVTKDDVWNSYNKIEDSISGVSVSRQGDNMTVEFTKRKGEKLNDHPIMKDEEFKALVMNNELRPSGKNEIVCVVKEDNVEAALDVLYKHLGFTKEFMFVMPDSSDKPDRIVRTNRSAQEVIDDFGNKYGVSTRWGAERELKNALKRFKMDVSNEDLKQKIQELVQLRQAYLRKQYAKEESSRLAWQVLIQDQRIDTYQKRIDRAETDEDLRDAKEYREEEFNKREAMLEELEARGVKGQNLHLKEGKWSQKDVSDLFKKLNKDKTNGEFFDKVFEKVKDLNMDIILNDEIDNNTGGSAAGKFVQYNWKYLNAEYITDQAKANTLLHELIHTVTAYADRCVEEGLEHMLKPEMVDAINELHNILDIIKRSDNFKHEGADGEYTDYGVANVREMLSEAGSNELFRQDLKKQNLWVKIKDAILRFFGYETAGAKQTTAYDAVMSRLDDLIAGFDKTAWEEYYRGSRYGERMEYQRADKNEGMASEALPKTLKEFVEPAENVLRPVSAEDDLSARGKAMTEIYSDPELVLARRWVDDVALTFNGRIGDASAGAYINDNGMPDEKSAKTISKYMQMQLRDYKTALEDVYQKGKYNPARKQVFDEQIAEVEKAIDFYDRFGKGEKADHDEEGIRFRGGDDANGNALGTVAKDSKVVTETQEHIDALGGKGKVVTSREELDAEGERVLADNPKAKGWYNTKTGEVTVYLPNCESAYDAKKTVFHEKIGHEGLRKVVGEENYKQFLHQVFRGMSKADKKAVIAKANQNGWDFDVAIDEYLSEKAETFGEPQKNTFWQNVRAKLYNVMRKLGFSTPLSINDVREALWLSKNHLENKRGSLEYQMRKKAFESKLKRDYTKEEMSKDERWFGDGDQRKSAGNGGGTEQDLRLLTPTGYSAKRTYEEALRKDSYLWTESHQDGMRSLLELQNAIVGDGGTIKDQDNAYWKINALGSKDLQEQERYGREICRPLTEVMSRILPHLPGGDSMERRQAFEDYVYAKHALERNRVLPVRDALEAQVADGTITEADAKQLQADFDALREASNAKLVDPAINYTLSDYYADIDNFIKSKVKNDFEANKSDMAGLSDGKRFSFSLGKGEYDDAAAIEFVKDCESMIGADNVKALGEALKRASDFALDKQYNSGLTSEEEHDRAKTMFHWYVPLRDFAEETAEDMYSYINEYRGTAKINVKAGGRTSGAKMPVATLLALGDQAVLRGNRNQAKQALLRLARSNESDLISEFNLQYIETTDPTTGEVSYKAIYPDFDKEMTGDEMHQVIQDYPTKVANIQATLGSNQRVVTKLKFHGDIEPLVKDKSDLREHMIDVYVGGKKHTLFVNGHPRAAQAVNGLIKNGNVEWVKRINNTMSQLATTYSWTFMARNASRDLEFATASLQALEGNKYTGKFTVNYLKLTGSALGNNVTNSTFNSNRQLFKKYNEGTLDMSNETERYFKEFVDNGGVTGYVQMRDVEAWQKTINKLSQGKGNKPIQVAGDKAAGIVRGYTNLISSVNEAVENQTRFACYMTSRQSGRTIQRSVWDAKNVSVNFNLTGAGSGTFSMKFGDESFKHKANRIAASGSAWWMKNFTIFYNAGVQGMARTMSVAKNAPFKAARNIVGIPMAMGLLVPMFNGLLASAIDDDDDRKAFGDNPYAQLPEYERRQNVCLYLGHGKWFKIPMAIELRAFYGMGDILAGMANSDLRPQKITDPEHKLSVGVDYAEEFAKEFMQITPMDMLGGSKVGSNSLAGGIAGVVTPSAVQPFVAVATNTSWTGTPISREADYNKYQPNYRKGTARTSKGFVKVAENLNNWTGGDEAKPGLINLNPAKMEYLFQQFGSGPAKDFTETVSTIWNTASGEKKLSQNNIPIGKAFYRPNTVDNSLNVARSRYYSYVDEKKKTDSQLRDYKGSKEVESRAKYIALKNSPQGRRYEVAKKYESEIKKLQSAKSAATSQADREALQSEINQLMKQCVNIMDLIERNRKRGAEGNALYQMDEDYKRKR